MSRWEPNGRGRLAQAALELYSERGFDETTVAEIAERAGLTERTFFRHFSDKREVLFGGQDLLCSAIAESVAAAPADADPMATAIAAIRAAGAQIPDLPAWQLRRRAVIAANPALQERELRKMAVLGGELADALRTAGVSEGPATLCARVAVTVFGIAFDRWVDDSSTRELSRVIAEVYAELRGAVSAGRGGLGGEADG
ncbi:TetR family transcriptional regulator [Nocardia nova]|uniref:TetR family transcriptional regulator n=1 Tax=Nocardia nova TaxID=37330 RepID=A0A2S6ATY5_9NOCA|nr:TetR family transcriptional regulator [Nocardia nova]PPJ30929.1 TetR family transcriptional regulator [Nocardia nova]PPJ38715.1 TetR family transcriptional regulator [Nocardia nova]